MHESGKNSVCPITDFKICIDPASAEVSGTVSTGFNGIWAGPWGSLRIKSGIERTGGREYLPNPAVFAGHEAIGFTNWEMLFIKLSTC